MKILHISHFRENSGWGRSAREYLLAMQSSGLDVVARAVKLGLVGNVSEEIQELENKSSEGCTHLIQHLLPHQMRFDGTFERCVALYDYELENLNPSGWKNILDQFSDIWVPCTESQRQLVQSGVKKEKIRVVPHAINLQDYEGPFEKIVGGDDSFKFYFIFDCNERKNLKDLILAFHSTFYVDEPVSLVLKTGKHGANPQQVREHIEGFINNLKTGMRIYPTTQGYRQEIIITERLTDKQILDLHYSCDCYVCPSHGEAFNYPAVEALAIGKPVISTEYGAVCDYVDESNGYLCNYTLGPAHGVMEQFQNLSTGFESWANIDVSDLSHAMRMIFDNRKSSYYTDLCKNAKESVKKFDRKVVGQRIKDLLCLKN